jgi:hypothetical protein
VSASLPPSDEVVKRELDVLKDGLTVLSRSVAARGGDLVCEGCGTFAYGDTDGWRAPLAKAGDGSADVVVLCPLCAALADVADA